MRIYSITSILVLGLLARDTTAQVPADVENIYDAPASGSSSFDNPWSRGGPSTWGGGTAVDGGISFDMTNSSGNITVGGIDANYTGITGLWTTDSNANFAALILDGNGSLSFYNGGNEIKVDPHIGLTLSVRTIFDGDVNLSTENMAFLQGELMLIEDSMALTQENSRLSITGQAAVQFTVDSTLSLNGAIVVGNSQSTGVLQVDTSEAMVGDMSLTINGAQSQVLFGTLINNRQDDYVLTGLFGDGGLIVGGPGIAANLTVTGDSLFSGKLAVEGDLNVTGAGTVFHYDPEGFDFASVKRVNLSDGASFILGRNEFDGLYELITEGISLDGGGMFGGDGFVQLGGGLPINALQITNGWLLGGDYSQGTGQLRLEGFFLGNFFGDAGIISTVNSDLNESEMEERLNESFIYWESTSTVTLSFGSRIHTNLVGSSFLNTNYEFTLMQSASVDGQGNPRKLILTAGAGTFDTTTNRVTRNMEILNTFDSNGHTDKLIYRIGADYAAPAGDLGSLGYALNSLIPLANEDPNSPAGELLGLLDASASTATSYQQTLGQFLPTTQFVADSAVANTMFYDVQRRNLRELAIGSRAPGMVKAARPSLLAANQEQDAVEAAAAQHPPIIIETTGNSSDSDVFQSLFVDGYGQWNSMRSIAFVPGYSSTSTGVQGGWGIALDHGFTLGLTAGWEHNKINTKTSTPENLKLDSFRGAPFVAWSGLLNNNIEQYAIFSVGGGYNYGSGQRKNRFGDNRNLDLHGWEVDIEGTVGTRVPLLESVAIQPEASIRYSILKFTGTETQGVNSYDYNGDTFQFVNGRVGIALEWFGTPELRATGRVGYQGQYYNWGTATWTLNPALGIANPVSESPGSGSISQAYVGVQLEWAPSWDIAISVNYDGAFGQATQNSISGGVLFRF